MPLPKRGATAKGREEDATPPGSPRKRAHETATPRGGKAGVATVTGRKPRTTEDVRAEASPIIPRGRGRPSAASKAAAAAAAARVEPEPSPSRRFRRNTELAADEVVPASSRARLDSHSTVASRRSTAASPVVSPMTSPRRTRKQSEMDPEDLEGPEGTEGRGKRKRRLTEAAEAAQSQSRSRKTSRRVSELQLLQHQERDEEDDEEEMEPLPHELAEPIMEEEDEQIGEILDEVAAEELVHAISPHGMHMQPHHHGLRPLHAAAAASSRTTRGMHVVAAGDEEDEEGVMGEEEDDEEAELRHLVDGEAIEEMVVYDDEGNMVMGYEGDGMAHEEVVDHADNEEMLRQLQHQQQQHHHVQQHQQSHHQAHLQQHSHHHQQQQQQSHHQHHQQQQQQRRHAGGHDMKEDPAAADDDDDLPPQLEPEQGPNSDEILMAESIERGHMIETSYDEQGYMRVTSPGGTQYMTTQVDDDMYVEGVDSGMMQVMDADPGAAAQNDLRTVEFNFLDNKHICCGLCGEIVPYDMLLHEHLPRHHPEVYGEGAMDLEEISYDAWLKDKLYHEKKIMENGFRTVGYGGDPNSAGMNRMGRNTRVLRRVSQVRVNPATMSIGQLDAALKKKMIEKMGRKVKVSLVDKQHARCGICNAVVSLNKKFEVIHLVRHFNAWHPSTHRCASSWPTRATLTGPGKPLSCQDFAVVDVALEAPESLQCIWCGMFMDRTMLAMHFHEVHADDVEVPKCHLCLQEIVINARLMEKYGEDFEVSLPDEHHLKCHKLNTTFSTEAALDRCIERRLRRMQAVESGEAMVGEEDEDDVEVDAEATTLGPGVMGGDAAHRDPQYSNSRMSFGRRNKPKRNFIMPSLRQAIPQDSRYVEALSEGQWKCKMCSEPILAAVISAGAIKHYRLAHPEQLEDMQYELCKARLERVSDGCMEFVHPQLIECLICNLTYALHKPYNMCRGIRHLKTKHPEMMPEFNRRDEGGAAGTSEMSTKKKFKSEYRQRRAMEVGEYVDDPEIIGKLKSEYDGVDFDKVQTVIGPNGQPIYVLVPNGEEVDERIVDSIEATILQEGAEEGEDDDEEEEEEEGVIVEGEEYQMDGDDMIVEEQHQLGEEEEEDIVHHELIPGENGDEMPDGHVLTVAAVPGGGGHEEVPDYE